MTTGQTSEQLDAQQQRPTPPEAQEQLHVFEVLVIGAGPAGMACATAMASNHPQLVSQMAILEETSRVGGMWNRQSDSRLTIPCHCLDDDDQETASTTDDTSGTTTSRVVQTSSQPIYEHLVTNLYKDTCSFSDFPFPAAWDLFLTPDQMGSYYQEYMSKKHPEVEQRMHLNTRVEQCWKEPSESVWTVSTSSTKATPNKDHHQKVASTSGTVPTSRIWKAKRLVVCTGHFRKAFVPNLKGVRHFKGDLIHTSAFGNPDSPKYKNKTILIVGAGISGSDIARLVSIHGTTNTSSGSCATRVLVSVRQWHPKYSFLLGRHQKKHGIVIRRGIERIDGTGQVHFLQDPNHNDKSKKAGDEYFSKDAGTETPDIIIFATGYRYHYPFFTSSTPNQPLRFLSDPAGYKMERLYQRILYMDDPTLAFFGVTNANFSPLMVMEYQAQWYAKIILDQKRFSTLTPALMEQEFQSRSHDMTQDILFFKTRTYCDSLARDIGGGVDGYIYQVLKRRLPLHLRSLWVHRHPLLMLFFSAVLFVPVVSVAVAWKLL
jgi:cation diffusion facilitator CzcD-associated flavoprotein CzcO